MSILLPPLPYDFDALEPFISKETMITHYKKHHQGYVDTLNELIRDTPYTKLSLDQIVIRSAEQQDLNIEKKIFNNASQAWNHTFYWNCLTSTHDQRPSQKLTALLSENFGSFDKFKEQFGQNAMDLFGSGWVWLVKNHNQKLEIISAQDAENPLTIGKIPLLTCDVWEHAYYLDYKNERKNYVRNFWTLVDWEFIEKRLQPFVFENQYLTPQP